MSWALYIFDADIIFEDSDEHVVENGLKVPRRMQIKLAATRTVE